ncbi:MAG: 50S ribosomal protein L22 [Bacteroidia bacterium]|nr:50S ribosomal protein L22 [Bacteroidia bacterium]
MGARKRLAAEDYKEWKKTQAFASLRNVPTSPRKMRLVADMIRGQRVMPALDMLKHSKKEASKRVEKLLLSAMRNWENKNETLRMDDQDLFVSEIFVDGGRALKRLRTAPQGRAHRIRKRSNHVTLYLGNYNEVEEVIEDVEVEEEEIEETED